MSRFRDRMTGTKYPESGVAPLPAEEVRAALFAVNGAEKPFRVRHALPTEKGDLVAEWRVLEPAWRSYFVRKQVDRLMKTRMLLDPEKHEVRSLDEEWQVTWLGDTPRLATSRAYGRGQLTTVMWEWEYERDADGHRRRVKVYRFDSRVMKGALQKAVLGAGWTWRGKMYKL
ncbi:hypothetical protein ACFV6M_06445 [Streptomyces californicus]|uniref:hypothetical protein n=1 Tax=Streptomyces TaxID=1883 RepID=UPI0004BF54CC|nr:MULTISPECIES: hypothetical protein [Streptomyces]MCF3165633.1 hypothetical protein [Streptomyces violaceoruber]MDW4900189.1 hypothetical protein [Streptomyces californicus]QRV56395.1 hypothetical protein I6J40_20980 [Streptomyces californicus]